MGMGAVWGFLREYGIIEGETIKYALDNQPIPPVNKGNDGIDVLHLIGRYSWESLRTGFDILKQGTIRQFDEYH